MKKLLALFAVETMKMYNEFKRYLFNTFTNLIVFFIIFIAMFYGIKFFAGPNISSDSLASLIIGYIMWTFAIIGFQDLAYGVYEEIQRGTLEQLYLSSIGIEIIFFFRSFLDFIFSLFFVGIVLIATMAVTGIWLSIDLLRVLPVLILSIPSLWGLGIFFGGLVMIFKKISSFMQIITFGLIGIVSVSAYPLNFYSFLPFAAGSSTIQKMIRNNQNFDYKWYLLLGLISLIYLIIGISAYKICENIARRKNLIGQY